MVGNFTEEMKGAMIKGMTKRMKEQMIKEMMLGMTEEMSEMTEEMKENMKGEMTGNVLFVGKRHLAKNCFHANKTKGMTDSQRSGYRRNGRKSPLPERRNDF